MNDDKKSPRGPRKGGSKPADQRGRGGKPSFGPKKPFVKRERPMAAEGERRDVDGGRRDFKRSYKPREAGEGAERGERPFRKGPRPEGKPFEKREGRKPYAPRGARPTAADGERPARDFQRSYKPREAGEGAERGERPFRKGPPRDGKPFEKTRKPYTPRGDRPVAADGEWEERRFDRPKREFGDRPVRDFADRPKRDFSDRPPRDATARKPEGGFKPRPRPPEAAPESGERIAKRLARAGIASRRDAEELIAAGRVKVNGKVLDSPAFNVGANDVIHLDGTEIPPIERTRLFLFHKPAGVVTTNRDPEGRKTVFDVLPPDLPRLMTIGRLDINTEGLLLLTNDGGLSRVLELPATGWLRRYRARVHGKVEESALAGLREGIAVDGVFYGSIEASLDREQGTNAWLTLGLREGKNREVKNILGALGLDVTRLIRISYGPFQLEDLPEGHVLEIKGRVLREQLGERLIEESGANFDAEIQKPFSNKPVRGGGPRREEADRPKFTRDGDHRPIGEGGLIKARKRREGSRDEALSKLSTKPDRAFGPDRTFGERGPKSDRGGFGDKPRFGGKKSEREQRPIEPPGQRKANVWMAPGARPIGKGRAEADAAKAAEAKARKASYKPGGKGKPGAKPFGKPRGERPEGDGGDRPRGPKRGGDADRRR
ncbi:MULTISPECIES: pseudouridine synthase [unclassified Mesorhizobium]|uniref:pseudouridine synthase n=1 Tax=unclassified Mesorhizobium TaxID=325217 RepID=UPI001CCAB19C|nr:MULTISPECIES: pseudouridine synthase [unclassified Mesorhizobium]MBZ9766727.1 pseudouridine synthase [Mesorhizobium sp. CA6]MBZ9912769.1 pseudouridine synthase [Mesorhizobium sp. CA16]